MSLACYMSRLNAPAPHGMWGLCSEVQPRKPLPVPVSTDVFCLQVSEAHLKTCPLTLGRSLNTAAAKSSLKNFGNNAHCQSCLLKKTDKHALCICKIWDSSTAFCSKAMPREVPWPPGLSRIKWLSTHRCLSLLMCFYGKHRGQQHQPLVIPDLQVTSCCAAPWAPSPLISQTQLHPGCRVTLPFKTRVQPPHAKCPNPTSHDSDHSPGVHLRPAVPITSYGQTTYWQWRWLPFLRHIGVGTDPNN